MIRIPGNKKYCVDAHDRAGNWRVQIRSVRGEVGVVDSFLWPGDEKPGPNEIQLVGEVWLAGKRQGKREGVSMLQRKLKDLLDIEI